MSLFFPDNATPDDAPAPSSPESLARGRFMDVWMAVDYIVTAADLAIQVPMSNHEHAAEAIVGAAYNAQYQVPLATETARVEQDSNPDSSEARTAVARTATAEALQSQEPYGFQEAA